AISSLRDERARLEKLLAEVNEQIGQVDAAEKAMCEIVYGDAAHQEPTSTGRSRKRPADKSIRDHVLTVMSSAPRPWTRRDLIRELQRRKVTSVHDLASSVSNALSQLLSAEIVSELGDGAWARASAPGPPGRPKRPEPAVGA